MSKEEMSILIIELLGKKTDWESWSKKFLLHGMWKVYKKLLVSSGSASGMDIILTQDKNENVLKGNMDLDKKITTLGELKELAYKNLTLLINTSSSVGKVAFGIVRNAKSADFSKGNCKIMWDRLISKYTLHIASSVLKLKSEFHYSKLESNKKDPDEWISNLEGLKIQMNEFSPKGSITYKDLMIHILNNLPEKYDVIYGPLETMH